MVLPWKAGKNLGIGYGNGLLTYYLGAVFNRKTRGRG